MNCNTGNAKSIVHSWNILKMSDSGENLRYRFQAKCKRLRWKISKIYGLACGILIEFLKFDIFMGIIQFYKILYIIKIVCHHPLHGYNILYMISFIKFYKKNKKFTSGLGRTKWRFFSFCLLMVSIQIQIG